MNAFLQQLFRRHHSNALSQLRCLPCPPHQFRQSVDLGKPGVTQRYTRPQLLCHLLLCRLLCLRRLHHVAVSGLRPKPYNIGGCVILAAVGARSTLHGSWLPSSVRRLVFCAKRLVMPAALFRASRLARSNLQLVQYKTFIEFFISLSHRQLNFWFISIVLPSPKSFPTARHGTLPSDQSPRPHAYRKIYALVNFPLPDPKYVEALLRK